MSRESPRQPKPGYQRFRMLLAYDGTDYYGWQRLAAVPPEAGLRKQTPTIQEVLEDTLSEFFNEKITVIGSGRTDAGVHATAQQAHFDAKPDDKRIRQVRHALRRMLPPSIVLKSIWLAPPEFHAIWSVEKKTYKYHIDLGESPNIYNRRFAHWLYYPLDLELLREHSKILLGNHDFASFKNQGSPVKTTTREIFSAEWEEIKPSKLVFSITGDGFLKQMVRNIVGTLIDLNKEGAQASAMKEILEACDRRKAHTTAPAHGLSLSRVFYPRKLDIQCRKL